MDIWMTWCKKKVVCRRCSEEISKASPMVVGKLWAVKGEKLRFTKRYYWHPDCWIQDGLNYLEQHPYSAEGKGRPRLAMSEGDKKKRYKVLSRRADLMRQLRGAVESGDANQILKVYERMEKLKPEIEKLGGIPESWQSKG